MLKIIHIADIHARDKDLPEIKKCLDFIVETAQSEEPDLIINAGDTFDSQNIKTDSASTKLIFDIFSKLADIAPVLAIIGTPSHDGEAAEVLQYIKARFPVRVSTYPEQIRLNSDGKFIESGHFPPDTRAINAVITAVPAPAKQFFRSESDIKGADNEIAAAITTMLAGFGAQASQYKCPHILVGHWNVTGSLVSETQTLTGVDIEISKDQMALANADLICLGHIHHSQKIEPNIFFSGSINANTWGELSPKGFYIHEIEQGAADENILTSRFIKTPSRRLARLSEDLTEAHAIDELDAILYSLSPDDLKDAHLKVDLKVFHDDAQKIDKEKIKNFYLSGGAKDVVVDLVRVPRANVRSAKILEAEHLRDKLVERARLADETVPESILLKADTLEEEVHHEL